MVAGKPVFGDLLGRSPDCRLHQGDIECFALFVNGDGVCGMLDVCADSSVDELVAAAQFFRQCDPFGLIGNTQGLDGVPTAEKVNGGDGGLVSVSKCRGLVVVIPMVAVVFVSVMHGGNLRPVEQAGRGDHGGQTAHGVGAAAVAE